MLSGHCEDLVEQPWRARGYLGAGVDNVGCLSLLVQGPGLRYDFCFVDETLFNGGGCSSPGSHATFPVNPLCKAPFDGVSVP